MTLTENERKVWAAWKELPDTERSPVKRIAAQLGMTPADVAFIVYPAEQFGPWADDQEPDLTAETVPMYTPSDDATPLDRALLILAQSLHDSGDAEVAEQLAVDCCYLRETWREDLAEPYMESALDKLEAIADSAQSAIRIIKRVLSTTPED